jgi:oligoribonuclease
MTDTFPEWLCWLDLETTGLDAAIDVPLELGIVLTRRDLVPVTLRSWLIRPPGGVDGGALDLMPPVVREMHAASGLLDALAAEATYTLDDVDEAVCAVLDRVCGEGVPVALAGSGVAEFDRTFINVFFPHLSARLYYRSLDIGSTRRLAVFAGRPYVGSHEALAHRALPDAEAALAQAAEFRDVLAVHYGRPR